MSSRATGTSSFTQMYCCLSRDPQVLCSRLNEMARLASVAEKSFTGIETIPNETVSVAIDRAAMAFLPEGEDIIVNSQLRCARCGSYGIFCGSSRLRALQRTLQALLAGQGLAPAIPGA